MSKLICAKNGAINICFLKEYSQGILSKNDIFLRIYSLNLKFLIFWGIYFKALEHDLTGQNIDFFKNVSALKTM